MRNQQKETLPAPSTRHLLHKKLLFEGIEALRVLATDHEPRTRCPVGFELPEISRIDISDIL
jgi:hypothetical protein